MTIVLDFNEEESIEFFSQKIHYAKESKLIFVYIKVVESLWHKKIFLCTDRFNNILALLFGSATVYICPDVEKLPWIVCVLNLIGKLWP